MSQAVALIQIIPGIKEEHEKRTEFLNQGQEDLLTALRREVIPLLSQRPATPAPPMPYAEMLANYMADPNAKEETPAPSGRRIWSTGRVRVYESRAGGGEDKVRTALNEIMQLRAERKDYDKSVDILAMPIEDMRSIQVEGQTVNIDTIRRLVDKAVSQVKSGGERQGRRGSHCEGHASNSR